MGIRKIEVVNVREDNGKKEESREKRKREVSEVKKKIKVKR